MNRIIQLIVVVLLFPMVSSAQSKYNLAEITHELRGLKVTGSVLYIAAHPDDENTRLISYLTKEKYYRVGYLALTRGDGGQNLIGTEQGKSLGILRTQELLAARRIDGGEQFFSSAFDFGYSKSPEETFRKWNKEKILKDVVYVIRQFQPDVIICRFPTTGEGGHGHHTASAILAEEAYDVAADASKYPELGAPWKTKRLFWNTFNFGNTNTTSEDQFKIDVGGYNDILGKSYGEIASEARSQHRCQAFGTEKRYGSQYEYFKLLKGEPVKNDLLDGIVTDWTRFKTLQPVYKKLLTLEKKFNPYDLNAIASALLIIYKDLQYAKLSDNENPGYEVWKKIITERLTRLILHCSGLYFELNALTPSVSMNDSLKVKLNIINRGKCNITLGGIIYGKEEKKEITRNLENNIFYSLPISFAPHHDKYKISNPYPVYSYNENTENKHYYALPQPEERSDIQATVFITINGTEIPYTTQLNYKYIDPSFGELFQPFFYAPPATINFSQDVAIVKNGQNIPVKVKVRSFTDNLNGTLVINVPDGWQAEPSSMSVEINKPGEEKEFEFQIMSLTLANTAEADKIAASIYTGNTDASFNYSIETIKYDHIPEQNFFTTAAIPLRAIDFNTNTKNIAYFEGAGDKVADVLTSLGYHVSKLSEQEILSGNLAHYDAIIIGIRAFNTYPQLSFLISNLLSYTEQGGNLVLQYNTSNSLKSAHLGPYPFTISRDRVTEEDATVTFLHPEHPLLNYPNKITDKDFENWIQERGLYFPADLSPEYETLFSMADENSKALETSLITCRYGKGKFVYTGLSFFRELPAGVPGAIRLFVNLISNNTMELPLKEDQTKK